MSSAIAQMQTEALLAEQCRGGDRFAFEELVRRTARGMFARFYLETGDVHRAEDLVQETYLAAWRSMRSLSDPTAFRGWLHAVANSVLIDAVRREGRKKRGGNLGGKIGAGNEVDDVATDEAEPGERAEAREDRELMLAALRGMPAEYRQPLMLRYLAGADYETISRELAITNGSLRGLLSRGMDMLRQRLKERP